MDSFKIGKGVCPVYCHPAYLTYMQSTTCEILAGWSTSWHWDFQEKYQYIRYTDDTTFMADSEEKPKSLLKKVKEESETAKSLQLCPTLCDPIDGSPPGSAVPGILQARTLEWAAISFSNARKWKVKVKLLSHVWLFATPWTEAHQAPPSMGFSRQEYWSGLPLQALLNWNSKDHLGCLIHLALFKECYFFCETEVLETPKPHGGALCFTGC